MKIAFISDIHANIYGLKAVLKKIGKNMPIYFAGDLVGYYSFVNEAIDEVRKRKIVAILGNQDQWFLEKEKNLSPAIRKGLDHAHQVITKENLQFLKKLKKQLIFKIDALKIAIYHGSPWEEIPRVYPDFDQFEKFSKVTSDIIVFGHTHYPMVKRVGKKLLINPGSCGQPRDGQNPSYAILDTKKVEAKIFKVSCDFRPVMRAAKKLGFDGETIEILKRKDQ